MNDKIAIVIPSCDKYSDLWQPLLMNLARTWPNVPFKIYIVSNYKACAFPRVHTIKVGEDLTWCANLITALDQVAEENIFLLIDDLFLTSPIDETQVAALCDEFVQNNWNYLRFNPTPAPSGSSDRHQIGEVKKGDYYRSSTVMCLWKKSVLRDILRKDESAWEFEIFGAARTDRYDGWYASAVWRMPYRNLVIKGKYDPSAYRALKKTGLPLDPSRPMMARKEHLRFLAVRLRAVLFRLVPVSMRRNLREKFKAA